MPSSTDNKRPAAALPHLDRESGLAQARVKDRLSGRNPNQRTEPSPATPKRANPDR